MFEILDFLLDLVIGAPGPGIPRDRRGVKKFAWSVVGILILIFFIAILVYLNATNAL